MARVSLSAKELRTNISSRLDELKRQKGEIDGEIGNLETTLRSLGDSDWNIGAITLSGVAGRYAPVEGTIPTPRSHAKKNGKRGRPVGS